MNLLLQEIIGWLGYLQRNEVEEHVSDYY